MAKRRRPKAFLTGEDGLRFEFFLAEKLGLSVARMRATISAREFMQWGVYYGIKAQEMQLARG